MARIIFVVLKLTVYGVLNGDLTAKDRSWGNYGNIGNILSGIFKRYSKSTFQGTHNILPGTDTAYLIFRIDTI